jgi:pyrrolidone-carboxylate peptidase
MLASTELAIDRRPSIVICTYDADDGSWDAIEDLSGAVWNPAGARTIPVPADAPVRLAERLNAHLRASDCRAVLLVGRTNNSDGFLIQMRAPNRTLDGTGRLNLTGPAIARTTAPVAEMVRAMKDAGLCANASSLEEDDAGSFLLYSILTSLPDDTDAPAVALLRAPVGTRQDTLDKGVRAAAAAIARHLSPLPRSRPH